MEFKKPVIYGSIPLTRKKLLLRSRHMFTGLKTQHELTDCLITDIVPHDHYLVKLKTLLNWEGINRNQWI
jgi:hypothetical protein